MLVWLVLKKSFLILIIITLDFRKPTERELSNWGHYNDRLEKRILVFVKLII